MKLQQIKKNKEDYMDLLLLADPSKEMIQGYLYDGELYTYWDETIIVAVAVVCPLKDGGCELKNIAVMEERQGKGIGSEFLRKIMNLVSKNYKYMLVGTTAETEDFYKSLHFKYSHTISNFFVDNYSEPIFENGIQCVDMRYFSIRL